MVAVAPRARGAGAAGQEGVSTFAPTVYSGAATFGHSALATPREPGSRRRNLPSLRHDMDPGERR